MNSPKNRRGPPRSSSSARGHAPSKSGSARALAPSTDVPDINSFREWALVPAVQDAIEAMGITVPTPVQRLAIGPVLDGRDVIAKAETGTGKTLAFGAPMMSKIDASRASVLGLVLCPTRELAQQVASVLEKLGESRGIKVALIVGGEPMGPQIDALKRGAQIVVGTPGRVIDLYGQRFLSFPWTEFVALDEADQMLEIGFIDDVRKILSYTPEERQTMLFSATFPDEVLRLAREATRDPVEVATASGLATVKTIHQFWMECARNDRPLALTRLIEQSSADDVFLVFCDRRTEVDQLMRQLERLPFSVKALHGGFDQASRFRVMSAFRTGEVKVLVATDVASRGLDVHLVSHVVNYSVPQDAEDYTHRIGRTGRAGREGTAITLVTQEHVLRWKTILRQAKWEVVEAPLPGRSGRGMPTPLRPARPDVPPTEAPRARSEAPAREDASVRRDDRERRGERSRPAPISEHANSSERRAPAARATHETRRAPEHKPSAERSVRDERRPNDDRAARPRRPSPATAAPEARPQRAPHAERPAARPRTSESAPPRRPVHATPDRAATASRARPTAPPKTPAARTTATPDRPRREMSTRDRLKLERENVAPSATPPATPKDGDGRARRPRRGPRSSPRAE